MELLTQAGRMSLVELASCKYEEERIHTIEIRKSLIDAFLSMINGIKSPMDNRTVQP